MDVSQTILDLRAELARIDAAIQTLEQLQGGVVKPRSKRGRKAMAEEERAEVSSRMKRYWAQRREQRVGERQSA